MYAYLVVSVSFLAKSWSLIVSLSVKFVGGVPRVDLRCFENGNILLLTARRRLCKDAMFPMIVNVYPVPIRIVPRNNIVVVNIGISA